jgi:hypothetical protein
MLKSVASCGFAWDNYYITVLSKSSGGDSGGASGSGSGESAQIMSRPSKRPFTAASPAAGRTADRHPASGGVAARQPFEPFVSFPN